ncbi:hypothetical protein ACF0H5_013969 [Mactra antiquata]
MSTDIGALQKQYKTLQQKQHQACVVLSGMGHKKLESVPSSPDSSIKETDYLNNSLSMMTLSVTMDTEKVPQKTSEAVSPMAFGKTKCIFIQNSTKKHPWKHKGVNDKTRHQKNELGKLEEENSGKEKAEDGEQVFKDNSDQIDTNTANKRNDNGTDDVKNDKTERGDSEIDENDTGQSCKLDDAVESKHYVVQEDDEAVFVENKVDEGNHISSEDGRKNDDNNTDKVEGGNEGTDVVSSKTDVNKEGCIENKIGKCSENTENKPANECKVNEKYRPYHPLKINKSSSKRHSSVKMANKQSIYQHFNMTKRQLSLDSALEESTQTNKTKYSADFPFPVHSINQHKIQAGMKLGLYDQNALKNLETLKPRKSGRKRLPSLNID